MDQTNSETNQAVVGAGSDSDPARRPGIPMEVDPGRPAGNAHWITPDRQPDPGGILRRKDLKELTPVFGVTIPPRGLSGLLRRAAYAIPEHYTSHWFTLLLADRVDVLESRLKSPAVLVPLLAAGAAGAFLAFHQPKRKWWQRF